MLCPSRSRRTSRFASTPTGGAKQVTVFDKRFAAPRGEKPSSPSPSRSGAATFAWRAMGTSRPSSFGGGGGGGKSKNRFEEIDWVLGRHSSHSAAAPSPVY